MAKYIVQDTSLAAVADAIRAKAGGTEKLVFPAGFVEAVENITGGGSNGGGKNACVVENELDIRVALSITAVDYE